MTQDITRLNRVIAKALQSLKPPDALTVTEWAEKYRFLSSEDSAEPGLFRINRTPYLWEIMDCFTDPFIRLIVFVAASQIGKSTLINNLIGYIIDEDPSSILFVHPTAIDAREYSKLRIAPMLRDCPTLRQKVSDKNRDSGNTILQKSYPGGILTLCGSGEAHSLSSKPIRYIFGDERDRWALSAGTEGGPWELAQARQRTFYNAKAVEVSTTIRGISTIEKSYEQGTRERWKTQCPHCGNYHEINFNDIRADRTERELRGKKIYTVIDVRYVCPTCAGVSTEMEMKHQPAHWEADSPEVRGIRSFWLNAFASPWAHWAEIIQKYFNALDDSNKLQVIYNTCFGWLWEERGDLADEEVLLKRREDYGIREDNTPVELPEGVLVLTCGVDTQNNRLEYEVVGHGYYGETWGIKKGTVMGRPDDAATWELLDDVIDHVYRFAGGAGLRISITFVDEGGLFTGPVRFYCHAREKKKVFCVKGRGGGNIPYTEPPKQRKIILKNRHVGCWSYMSGVDAGKRLIMENLKVKSPGSRYCHFPIRDDYGPAYFHGLLSERLHYNKKRKRTPGNGYPFPDMNVTSRWTVATML